MQVKKDYERWHSIQGEELVDDKYHNWLMKNINPEFEDSILDIAMGTGCFLQACEGLGLSTTGVDISETAIIRAKSRLKSSDLIMADGEYLPLRDCSFDVVTCLGSLEHFSRPEKGVKEIARILRENGKAYILVPNAYFLGHIYLVYRTGEAPDEGQQRFSEHFRTIKEWERLLSGGNLKVLKCFKYNRITRASTKVSAVVRVIYTILIMPILPMNLSYNFLFVCEKAPVT